MIRPLLRLLIRPRQAAAALALVLASFTAPAAAHISNTGLATLKVDGERLQLDLALTSTDLQPDDAALLKRAGDGDAAAAQAMQRLVTQAWVVEANGQPCRNVRFSVQGSRVSDDRVLVHAEFRCASAPGQLVLRDGLVRRLGAHYRTVLTIQPAAGATSEHILDRPDAVVERRLDAPASRFGRGLFAHGIEHIATGVDHLLFVLALMLGTRGLWPTLGVVTMFTLAHSLSLALAVLGLVNIDARFVEPLIAASIAWMGWQNLRRDATKPLRTRALAAFGFGLVHGLGFASALGELSLGGAALAWALLSFNAGVEFGQAVVVVALLPLLARLDRSPRAAAVQRGLCIALIGIGSVWALARLAGA